jgi:CheY-like chemotaxis protein
VTTEISILIVDDEPAWYGPIIASIDSMADVAFEWRATLAEGLALVRSGRSFDLVLLNLGLPDVVLPRGETETASAWRLFRRQYAVGALWVCTGLRLDAQSLAQIREAGDRVVGKAELDRVAARQIASDIVAEAHRRQPGESVCCDSGLSIPARIDADESSEIRQLSTVERRSLVTSLTDLAATLQALEASHA